MNQARIANLVSKLNYKVLPRSRRLKNSNGGEGRSFKLQKTLTALLKYERIELNYNRADETRGYVEQVIIILFSQMRKYIQNEIKIHNYQLITVDEFKY